MKLRLEKWSTNCSSSQRFPLGYGIITVAMTTALLRLCCCYAVNLVGGPSTEAPSTPSTATPEVSTLNTTSSSDVTTASPSNPPTSPPTSQGKMVSFLVVNQDGRTWYQRPNILVAIPNSIVSYNSVQVPHSTPVHSTPASLHFSGAREHSNFEMVSLCVSL